MDDLEWYEPKYSVLARLDYAEGIGSGVLKEDQEAFDFIKDATREPTSFSEIKSGTDIPLTNQQERVCIAIGLLSSCRAMREGGDSLSQWSTFVIAGAIDRSLRALEDETQLARYICKEEERKRSAAIGGKSHHALERKAFKNDYRAERNEAPTDSRAAIVDSLYSDYEEVVKRSTMDTWAAAADKEDGFARKAGKQKKKG